LSDDTVDLDCFFFRHQLLGRLGMGKPGEDRYPGGGPNTTGGAQPHSPLVTGAATAPFVTG
jgi:hypothetical protein